MRHSKIIASSLFASALSLAATASAQTVVRGQTLMEADADGNGYLTRDEARAIGLGDHFDDLDADSDNRLETREFEAVQREPGLLVVPEDPDQIPVPAGPDTGPPTAGGVRG
jgi:hypothetical protein